MCCTIIYCLLPGLLRLSVNSIISPPANDLPSQESPADSPGSNGYSEGYAHCLNYLEPRNMGEITTITLPSLIAIIATPMF